MKVDGNFGGVMVEQATDQHVRKMNSRRGIQYNRSHTCHASSSLRIPAGRRTIQPAYPLRAAVTTRSNSSVTDATFTDRSALMSFCMAAIRASGVIPSTL